MSSRLLVEIQNCQKFKSFRFQCVCSRLIIYGSESTTTATSRNLSAESHLIWLIYLCDLIISYFFWTYTRRMSNEYWTGARRWEERSSGRGGDRLKWLWIRKSIDCSLYSGTWLFDDLYYDGFFSLVFLCMASKQYVGVQIDKEQSMKTQKQTDHHLKNLYANKAAASTLERLKKKKWIHDELLWYSLIFVYL